MVFVLMFEGDDGKTKIYQYNMMQNQKSCVTFFEEDKYKQVVLETNFLLKAKLKMANKYHFSTFIVIHDIRIRTQFLTIRCSTSTSFMRETSHSRYILLGSLVSKVREYGLLKNMRRFLCP